VQVKLQVQLERQGEGGPVLAPRYPGEKQEFWWLIVGDESDNVLAIKRLMCESRHQATLVMDMPASDGKQSELSFKLSFMCDSYLGCDQEYPFTVKLTGGAQEAMLDDE
jgi:pre-mRNA-splicing helicase BRR2